MRAPLLLTLACVFSGLGCAHSMPNLRKGQVEGPPALSSLPEIGKRAYTKRTRQGLLVAKEAFDHGLPAPPPDHSYHSLQQWVDQDVVQWLVIRSKAVSVLSWHFGLEDGDDNAGDRGSATQPILGHALVGLLQENTARALMQLPVPAELADEPQIQDTYREVVAAHAAPFLSAALVAFRECSNIAFDGPVVTRHFAKFCDGRFRRLRTEVEALQGHQQEEPPDDLVFEVPQHPVATDPAP